MKIEEKKLPHFPLSEVPYGGIFKSMSGFYYMRIRCAAADLHTIPVINIETGSFDSFNDNALVKTYFENPHLILE